MRSNGHIKPSTLSIPRDQTASLRKRLERNLRSSAAAETLVVELLEILGVDKRELVVTHEKGGVDAETGNGSILRYPMQIAWGMASSLIGVLGLSQNGNAHPQDIHTVSVLDIWLLCQGSGGKVSYEKLWAQGPTRKTAFEAYARQLVDPCSKGGMERNPDIEYALHIIRRNGGDIARGATNRRFPEGLRPSARP